jgi:hypothetical protein
VTIEEKIVLARTEEQQRLNKLREAFQKAFPNPERKGCPDRGVLRALVAGRMEPGEKQKWIDHFCFCSPCSEEYSELRRARLRTERLRTAGIAAAVILCAALGVWGWKHSRIKEGKSSVTPAAAEVTRALREQIVDLRNWSQERSDGATGGTTSESITLHRWNTQLVIYLPMGSEPGKYEIRIVGKDGKPLLNAGGTARVESGNTVFRAEADFSRLAPGQYLLGIRQPPWEWRFLRVALR